MAKKGENIYLRKDGRWEGRYIKERKPDGKPRFVSIYGKTYSDIKKRLIMIKADQYKSGTSFSAHNSCNMQEWSNYWLEILTKPYIKPETYIGYKRVIDKHISPNLGQKKVADITPQDIQETVLLLQKRLAPTTLRGVLRLLKCILNAACEKNLISHTPYQGIKLPKAPKQPPRVLTKKEQEKLEKEALSTNKLEYMICLYTGLRVGEVCALKWRDIDFESRIMHVRHSVHRIPAENNPHSTYLAIGSPKSESSVRDIPLPYFLADILYEKKQNSFDSQDDFVLKGTKGDFCDPRTMQQRIKKDCEKLEIQDVHMHTLRHTFATRCLESGVHYEVLCEFLGHSSPQITLRHYAHCTPERKRESIDLLKCDVL